MKHDLLKFLTDEVLLQQDEGCLDQLAESLFDFTLLRAGLAGVGLCDAEASDEDLFSLYMSDPQAALISPCRLFSEACYRAQYPDVEDAINRRVFPSGFIHYLKVGLYEGRWPSRIMKEIARSHASAEMLVDAALFDIHLDAQAYRFLAVFSWISPAQYYNLYGRHMGCRAVPVARAMPGLSELQKLQAAEFDQDYYRARYLDGTTEIDALQHYFSIGAKKQYSPNSWFQEDWYQAFYWDVCEAVERGILPSGFCHYLISGRTEGRMPAYDLSRALELKMPGVTDPVLLRRTEFLKDRVRRVRDIRQPTLVSKDLPTIWFVLPVLNADISFGGYQACYALMSAAFRHGFRIGIICMEEQRPNRDYFIWRTTDPVLRQIVSQCELFGRDYLPDIEVTAADLFVAYSVWDLAIAASFAKVTRNTRPFLLMQEYEPVFYDSSSMRAMCAEQYTIKHIPIINSHFLLLYARKNKIGIFADDAADNGRYICFEHKINALPAQSRSVMASRSRRVLAAYARPEAHASRNLFEMIVISLQRLCEEGIFDQNWVFIGLGALSDLSDIYLGNGHSLKLMKKMDEQEYVDFMGTLDIGISMMDAPHPSVVPFEFATTGALVITNTYENRSKGDLTSLSNNFIPCDISLDGMEGAIREAVSRVMNFDDRAANVFAPDTSSWARVFSPDVVRKIFGRPNRPAEIGTKGPSTRRNSVTPLRAERTLPKN